MTRLPSRAPALLTILLLLPRCAHYYYYHVGGIIMTIYHLVGRIIININTTTSIGHIVATTSGASLLLLHTAPFLRHIIMTTYHIGRILFKYNYNIIITRLPRCRCAVQHPKFTSGTSLDTTSGTCVSPPPRSEFNSKHEGPIPVLIDAVGDGVGDCVTVGDGRCGRPPPPPRTSA